MSEIQFLGWVQLVEDLLMALLTVAALWVELRALIHALTTRVDAFPAADSRTKGFWVAVLAGCTLIGSLIAATAVSAVLNLAAGGFSSMLLGVIAVTVAAVYLAGSKPRIEGVLANAQSPGSLW